ncbi:MAG TPA: aminomethyl transferase family protein [Humibacter sp.]|jgi:glycine cleavage system aminomethyltransferase T|nr:aminomethyl transferase family protein [Humibacter sp.]
MTDKQNPPTLQDAIDRAGSPMRLLWKPDAAPWDVPVLAPEYAGWQAEQDAWRSGVAISDLSFHMFDTVVEGPDATRLLSEVSANNFANFAIGQAKQFVPVAYDGNIITDGILLRQGEDRYTLSGVPAAQNWVKFHGSTGGYDVAFETDPDSSVRTDRDPKLFRFQVQGPHALELVARAFGGPLPETKFFHSVIVELNGVSLRALRHGMAGQAGYEFIGDYAHHDAVLDALLAAGEPLDVVQVGGLAYFTNGVESGWIPTPTPAIYLDDRLADYRKWLPMFSYEGMKPLSGSYYSDDVRDYYLSPWELGYGRSLSFDHDFIGRDELLVAKDHAHRAKVTVELDPADVAGVFGDEPGYVRNYDRHRIQTPSGELVGMTFWTASIAPVDRILALSLIETSAATPGTQVEIVWGEHPGAGTAPDADLGLPRIRGTVAVSPYNEYTRTAYRAGATA